MKKSQLKEYIKGEIISTLSEDVDDDYDVSDAELKKGDSIAVVANKLKETEREMKSVVKKWKSVEGDQKEDLLNRLKELTKIKKELESLL